MGRTKPKAVLISGFRPSGYIILRDPRVVLSKPFKSYCRLTNLVKPKHSFLVIDTVLVMEGADLASVDVRRHHFAALSRTGGNPERPLWIDPHRLPIHPL